MTRMVKSKNTNHVVCLQIPPDVLSDMITWCNLNCKHGFVVWKPHVYRHKYSYRDNKNLFSHFDNYMFSFDTPEELTAFRLRWVS